MRIGRRNVLERERCYLRVHDEAEDDQLPSLRELKWRAKYLPPLEEVKQVYEAVWRAVRTKTQSQEVWKHGSIETTHDEQGRDR